MSKKAKSHWSEEKEVIKTNRGIIIMLRLLKVQPRFLVRLLLYPISFFYFIFARKARRYAAKYQFRLFHYTKGKSPIFISVFRQILAFAFCVEEKMEGWLGKYNFKNIYRANDDCEKLIQNLENGKGAVVIGSHLGNIELLRSIAFNDDAGTKRKFKITILMNKGSTEIFSNSLKAVNPDYDTNVIDSSSIGPDTIIQLMEDYENGGLIVILGDRTTIESKDRVISKDFLGKKADFPYGVFLIPALIKAPVYFMFGLRNHTNIFSSTYTLYVKAAENGFEDFNRNEREKKISALCSEFVKELEHYTIMYPYQWYNFFDFWNED